MGASTTASSNDDQSSPPSSSMDPTNGGVSQSQPPPQASNLDQSPQSAGSKPSQRQTHIMSNAASSETTTLFDGSSAEANSNTTNKFRLRWDNFSQSVVSSFRRLKEEEDFVDVTLACNSKQFTAHKVVLSACSPYFRRLLKVKSLQIMLLNLQILYILYRDLATQ